MKIKCTCGKLIQKDIKEHDYSGIKCSCGIEHGRYINLDGTVSWKYQTLSDVADEPEVIKDNVIDPVYPVKVEDGTWCRLGQIDTKLNEIIAYISKRDKD